MIKTFFQHCYKGFVPVLFVMLFSMVPTSLAVLAADAPGYVPLVSIPALNNQDGTVNISGYIPGAVRLAIQIAGALAVIMIVIGGVQYASTDAINGKSEGKERIQNAIYGLLLAIGAFFILNSVNPETLNLNLEIKRPGGSSGAVTTPPANPATPANPLSPGDLAGKAWPAAWPGGISITDSEVRALLNGFPIKVEVNRPNNCKTVGEACTSLDGLSQSAIGGLRSLSTGCKSTFSCGGNSALKIRITGGTEFWNHGVGSLQTDPTKNPTLHRPGGGAIDLSKNGPLDSYIQSFPKIDGRNGCATGNAFNVNGDVYVDEFGGVPHWHICY